MGFSRSATCRLLDLLFLILRIQLVFREIHRTILGFIWISRVCTSRLIPGTDGEGPRGRKEEWREEGKREAERRRPRMEMYARRVRRGEAGSVYRLPWSATSRTGAPTCTNTFTAKKARALYIMIRHFGITTKRGAATPFFASWNSTFGTRRHHAKNGNFTDEYAFL